MKKLQLDLNQLKVDSFQTDSNNKNQKGTVKGETGKPFCYPVTFDPSPPAGLCGDTNLNTCEGTCYNTCNYTCGDTCGDTCGNTCVRTCNASCYITCEISCTCPVSLQEPPYGFCEIDPK